jgi:hypothetical protein
VQACYANSCIIKCRPFDLGATAEFILCHSNFLIRGALTIDMIDPYMADKLLAFEAVFIEGAQQLLQSPDGARPEHLAEIVDGTCLQLHRIHIKLEDKSNRGLATRRMGLRSLEMTSRAVLHTDLAPCMVRTVIIFIISFVRLSGFGAPATPPFRFLGLSLHFDDNSSLFPTQKHCPVIPTYLVFVSQTPGNPRGRTRRL